MGLSAEVNVRLDQLDLILTHLRRAIAVITPDQEEMARRAEWTAKVGPLLERGEIPEEVFWAGIPQSSPEELRAHELGWKEVRLFTEVFYFVAWRLREVLNTQGPYAFPHRGNIEAKGIRTVRNLLLEHPEHATDPNYRQDLSVTDDGPVLKSLAAVFYPHTGRAGADPESLDHGLYVNAKEFGQEVEACLQVALDAGRQAF
jgi:hypothetical protein